MYKRMTQGVGIDDGVEYVQRDSDKALIPCVDGNPDYEKYKEDVSGGAKVEEFDYAAEHARQNFEKNKEKSKTLEERVAALEAKVNP